MAPLIFAYKNHVGKHETRFVIPTGPLYWGRTEYHPAEQWLLPGWDLHRGAHRVFAVKDIDGFKVQEE